jgi:Tol biopolymer transport system component
MARLVVALACLALATADRGWSAPSDPAVVVQKGGALYAVAVDGSRRVRLLPTRLPGRDAALSPDGSTIVYSRAGGISTLRLDGSHRRIITRGADSRPAWASDGRTIYFVRDHVGRFGAPCGSIFAVSASGTDVRLVANPSGTGHSYNDPAPSPDGRRIAFSDWDACEGGTSSPRLRVVDLSGRLTGDLVHLRHNGYYPDPEHSCPVWSPDGTRLAYRRNADLAVANRDGSDERTLVRGGGYLWYESPAWSPDGRWIAFTQYNRSRAVVVHPDGTGLHVIARFGKADYSLVGWLPRMPK